MHKKYIFNKKIAPDFFIFHPEPCLGALQRPVRAQECLLSRRVPPPQYKFLAASMSGTAPVERIMNLTTFTTIVSLLVHLLGSIACAVV